MMSDINVKSSSAVLLSRGLSILLLLLAIVAAGCRRRPLEDPDYLTNVRVKVNVAGIPNVTSDIYNDKIPVQKIEPSAMHVLFFGEREDVVAAEDFITDVSYDEDGNRIVSGEVKLAPGSYRMLVYDFGTEATLIRNHYNWDRAEAYTEPVPSSVLNRYSAKGEEALNILTQPEHLVVARNACETVPYHNGIYTICAEATSVVESWYIQVKVDGLEYVSSAQAILSGMVGANLIATNTRVDDPEATIWFSLRKSDDKGQDVICAVFNTFGRIPESDNNFEVTFDLAVKGGTNVRKTFNISDLFLTENAVKHHWLLLEDTIKVEPPKNAGGAFDPKVDDWEDEHQDIDI